MPMDSITACKPLLNPLFTTPPCSTNPLTAPSIHRAMAMPRTQRPAQTTHAKERFGAPCWKGHSSILGGTVSPRQESGREMRQSAFFCATRDRVRKSVNSPVLTRKSSGKQHARWKKACWQYMWRLQADEQTGGGSNAWRSNGVLTQEVCPCGLTLLLFEHSRKLPLGRVWRQASHRT